MSLNTVGKQIKYGLIPKKAAAPVAPQRPKVNAFSLEDSDEDTNAVSEVARVNAQLARRRAADEAALQAAANEDPSIYDYDGAYDSFKTNEKASHQLSQPTVSKEPPKSRYVSNLMSTAKLREKEKDRIYERKLLKEREVEDKEFGDKPKFMTAAYKKKLQEDQKWEYEDRLADALEQKTDVRKSGMQGFYANLLTKNVAMGGDVEHAVSVYTAGSVRQAHLLDEPAATGSTVAHKSSPAAHSIHRDTEHRHSAEGERRQHDHEQDSEHEGEVAGDSSIYRDARRPSATNVTGHKRPIDSRDEGDRKDDHRAPVQTTRPAELDVTSSKDQRDAPRASVAAPTQQPQEAHPAQPAAQAPAPIKTEQILSAKDRYLQRKLAQQQQQGQS